MRRRPLLRAAAVGGGAYALGKHSANKQAEQQQQAYDEGASSTAPPAAVPASSGITQQDTERLAELGRLHDSGVLTDEEFAQQKSRILGV
jgi:hypothetical protein